MRSFVALAVVGFVAQLVDGSLGMAYGVTSSTLLLATGVALLSSLVAGYFPARAAARLHPVDIIRGAT